MAPSRPDNEPVSPREHTKVADKRTRVVKPWTFREYRNGLLDLKAPAKLMNITRRNSLESPLLRLPAEIRNKIFAYALGGNSITIRATRTPNTAYVYDLHHKAKPRNGGLKNYIKPNFQLARVCRQLYAETAVLPYSLNTFRFRGRVSRPKDHRKYSGHEFNLIDLWLEKRKPAQVRAISSLKIPIEYCLSYCARRRPAFKRRFPNLQRLLFELPKSSQGLVDEIIRPKVRAIEQESTFKIRWRFP